MKLRQFNKMLRSVVSCGAIDQDKVKALPDEIREECLWFIVKKRAPIFEPFINSKTNLTLLAGCGYMYWKKGKLGNFLCTCAHQIK